LTYLKFNKIHKGVFMVMLLYILLLVMLDVILRGGCDSLQVLPQVFSI